MTSAVAHSKTKQDGALRTLLSWSHDRIFTGFVFDGANLSRHFVVELVVDGRPLRSVHATDYVNMLAEDNIGDGCYGFCFSLDASTLSDADCVEARIANTGVRVGEPIAIRAAADCKSVAGPSSGVQWLGGVRFSGWISDGPDSLIDIEVDGEGIDRVRASGWCHVGDGDNARAVRSFSLHLPMRFADGAVHRLAAVGVVLFAALRSGVWRRSMRRERTFKAARCRLSPSRIICPKRKWNRSPPTETTCAPGFLTGWCRCRFRSLPMTNGG